jgi:hypothetical protein
MHKIVWSGIAACLVAVGFGVYWSVDKQPAIPAVLESTWEEQEPVAAAPFVAALDQSPSAREAAEVVEPIVVEDAFIEPPPPPQFGGAALPGQGIRVVALGADQPPRPDEEPGEHQHMPYVGDGQDLLGLTAIWETVWRMVAGNVPSTTVPVATEEQAEPELPRIVPAVLDYHRHEMHCPYSGRCVTPSYPVPPPAAPNNK